MLTRGWFVLVSYHHYHYMIWLPPGPIITVQLLTMTDQHPSSAYAIERTVVGGGDRVVGTTGCCDISLLSCAEC